MMWILVLLLCLLVLGLLFVGLAVFCAALNNVEGLR